ncbi:MAG: DUF1338 family protein [Rickettsiales bacterium]|nr:DUF1338 family protein [Rickettsiales bacterium]
MAFLDTPALRTRFCRSISEYYYDTVPGYKRLCDTVFKQKAGDVPMDHMAVRFVDRQAVKEVEFFASALGLRDQGVDYKFPDKKLIARSFGVPAKDGALDLKIFVSTLDFEAYPPNVRKRLEEDEQRCQHRLSAEDRSLIQQALQKNGLDETDANTLFHRVLTQFFQRPVPIIESTYRAIREHSPAAAIGALCAGRINHVTPLVNRLELPLDDIDTLFRTLKESGFIMAGEAVQGAPGSPLRQCSTQAEPYDIPVLDEDGKERVIQEGNEYIEFAERPEQTDTASGEIWYYGAFKPEQATNIYLSNVAP